MPSMQPTVQDLHVDALLTILSIAYMNQPSAYIADVVFPVVPVPKQSDKYPSYTKGDWFRDEAQIRSPGTESQGSGYNVATNNTYFCDNFSIHKDIPDELRENADAPFEPDVEATEFVTDRIRIRREKAFATDFMVTGKWATDKTGTTDFTKWSDYGFSDPITDIEAGREGIFSVTALDPNTLVVGRAVWSKIKHHPDFIERIKYTQRGVLTADIVASVLEIERLLIARAIENTAIEGQTATMAYIVGKKALLAHVAPRPSLRRASAGYTFHWRRFGGLTFIRRLRDDFKMLDRIEAHTYFDQKLVASDCGYFFDAAVA